MHGYSQRKDLKETVTLKMPEGEFDEGRWSSRGERQRTYVGEVDGQCLTTHLGLRFRPPASGQSPPSEQGRVRPAHIIAARYSPLFTVSPRVDAQDAWIDASTAIYVGLLQFCMCSTGCASKPPEPYRRRAEATCLSWCM
jgi:hypothetical protein